jgi:hypothetical protein
VAGNTNFGLDEFDASATVHHFGTIDGREEISGLRQPEQQFSIRLRVLVEFSKANARRAGPNSDFKRQ